MHGAKRAPRRTSSRFLGPIIALGTFTCFRITAPRKVWVSVDEICLNELYGFDLRNALVGFYGFDYYHGSQNGEKNSVMSLRGLLSEILPGFVDITGFEKWNILGTRKKLRMPRARTQTVTSQQVALFSSCFKFISFLCIAFEFPSLFKDRQHETGFYYSTEKGKRLFWRKK